MTNNDHDNQDAASGLVVTEDGRLAKEDIYLFKDEIVALRKSFVAEIKQTQRRVIRWIIVLWLLQIAIYIALTFVLKK